MTNERELLNEVADSARRLFPETWEGMLNPEFEGRWVRIDAKAWAALGATLMRLEDLRAMLRVIG